MMELPQARPFGTQGRKPTHDFLSLYSHSTAQHDPRQPPQANLLKTRDFLQPLEERKERKGSATAKDDGAANEMLSAAQKTPPPVEPNILPGGIGTFSISPISSFKRNQRVLKADAGSVFTVAQASSTDKYDENSNCSSYSGSDFSLWEESAAVKKGKAGKENHVGDKPFMAESAEKLEQWTLSKQTSSFSNNHRNSFNCTRSSQTSGQKNQSLLEMLKSTRNCNTQDAELDNSRAFLLGKESSNTQRGELRVKVDGKSTDQKPNTPRSKHSATEQRRRSKINDRFQMLRAIIPHSEQKRDKASFLLEVIEYVHFLQEKVHKYERSLQGWNHQPEKLMPWRNDQKPAESYLDQSGGTNSDSGPPPKLLFASKIEDRNISISPTIPGSIHNLESGMSTKAMSILLSPQQNFLAPAQRGGPGGVVVSQTTQRLATDAENSMCQASMQCQPCSCAAEMATTDDKPKEKDLSIEGGAISISSVYSKGLLHTLTEALQSSGVDLSQANMSVQIELGRQTNIRPSPTLDADKDDVFPSRNKGMGRSRVARAEDSEQAVKKLKTCRS